MKIQNLNTEIQNHNTKVKSQLCRPCVAAWQGVSIHLFLKENIISKMEIQKYKTKVQKYKTKIQKYKNNKTEQMLLLGNGYQFPFLRLKNAEIQGNKKYQK